MDMVSEVRRKISAGVLPPPPNNSTPTPLSPPPSPPDNSGRGNLFHISLEPITSLMLSPLTLTTPNGDLIKILHSSELSASPVKSLNSLYRSSNTELTSMAPSEWRGLLLNVPFENVPFSSSPSPETITNSHAVIVRRDCKVIAPILVLCELHYKGNIGTIIRSAVQSNVFSSICIIDPPNPTYRSKDKDIIYYSMMNAPLIPIKRFSTTEEFLAYDSQQSLKRDMIATALMPTSINIYSSQSQNILANPAIYLLLGTESEGLTMKLMDECKCFLQIPSLSSSVNVSCAFSVVLTVMIIARLR